MTTSTHEPRPIIPALEPFYHVTRDLSWLVVRLTAGGMLLVHGMVKLHDQLDRDIRRQHMARRGIEPAIAAAYMIFFLERVVRFDHPRLFTRLLPP